MAGIMLGQEFIDEVIARNDIVSTISRYVTLTRRGNNYWACCPFHMEKTPSMSIKEDGQFFKCFGCGVGGNVISFIMGIENVDFFQAIEILCKNAGIELPSLEENSEMKEKKRLRDRLLTILSLSTEFYINNLSNPKAQAHIDYLNKRGLNGDMLNKFKIGASLDFNSLPNYLKSKGFTYEEMVQAGVVGKNDNSGFDQKRDNYYDFYGGRLIFPIFNGLGDVVGFSGRDITNNPEKAKYKNTPQTQLFNKSGLIYGYNFLRELKRNHMLDSIILVEGQMDVIACHQAGITNAVGCLGTAFTLNHAKDLSHLSNNIILCLDGDGAGANATYKALSTLREANMNVSVVRLEGAKDPDEYIKKFGKEQFVDSLANAMNYMEFILIDLAKKYDLSKNNEKNEYINEALKYLSKLSTASEQEIYLGVLREIVNVPIDALRKTLTGAKESIKPVQAELDTKEINENNFIQETKILILASILYKKIDNYNDFEYIFSNADNFKEIYEYLKEKFNSGQVINISTLYSIFDIKADSLWDKVINYNFPNSEIFIPYFNDATKRLKIGILRQKKEDIKKSLAQINNLDEIYLLMAKISEIDNEIKKLDT